MIKEEKIIEKIDNEIKTKITTIKNLFYQIKKQIKNKLIFEEIM